MITNILPDVCHEICSLKNLSDICPNICWLEFSLIAICDKICWLPANFVLKNIVLKYAGYMHLKFSLIYVRKIFGYLQHVPKNFV